MMMLPAAMRSRRSPPNDKARREHLRGGPLFRSLIQTRAVLPLNLFVLCRFRWRVGSRFPETALGLNFNRTHHAELFVLQDVAVIHARPRQILAH